MSNYAQQKFRLGGGGKNRPDLTAKAEMNSTNWLTRRSGPLLPVTTAAAAAAAAATSCPWRSVSCFRGCSDFIPSADAAQPSNHHASDVTPLAAASATASLTPATKLHRATTTQSI